MEGTSEALAARMTGPVMVPGDAGYDAEVAAANLAVRHTPDVVAGVTSAADAAAALRFAAEMGYRVTVQDTGHGAHAPIASGLLISPRRLNGVEIDAAAGTATVGGGATWAPVVAAAAAHGLCPVTGSSTAVGVAGYLLGGGLGPLARSHGFSSDYLLGATVVTGAGETLAAGPDSHPDLFWALRGGREGLGVVTELRLRLVRLATLYGGSLFFEEAETERVLRTWLAWTATADPRVTTSVAFYHFPDLDVLPPPLRGRRLFSLRFAYPGPAEDGARLAAPLRAAGEIYLDRLGELPVAEIARIHSDPTAPAPSRVGGRLLTHAGDGLAGALLAHLGPRTGSPFTQVELRHIAGATGPDVAGGSAVGGRGAAFVLGYVGTDPATFARVLPDAAGRLVADLGAWIAPVTNVNFLGGAHTAAELAGAWPADTFARLAAVRRRYDPRGVLAFGT